MADGVDIKTLGDSKLATVTVTMTVSSSPETIFIPPTGFVCRLTGFCVKNTSASLAGATSISITNFRQTIDVSSMTTPNTDYMFFDGNNAKYTETAADVPIQITKTTGSTVAATATIDLFGYLETA